MDQFLEQLYQYLHGIWLRRFWGLAVAWVVAVAGLAAAFAIPSKYEATARVFVDTESVLKPLMEGLAVQPNMDQQVDMLADTLLSRPNVEKLIQVAGLGAATEPERESLIEDITRSVQLSGSTRDNLFSISYRDTDQAQAKRLVESLLSMFVESGLSNKRRDTGKALEFLDAQIHEYETVLREAEARLKEFKLQNLEHLTASQDSVGSMLTLDVEIDKARSDVEVAKQRRDALRVQLAGEQPALAYDSAERVPGMPVPLDPLAELDSRADALRKNLDELLRKYTDEHPDVVGIRRTLVQLAKEREALVQAQAGGAGARIRRQPNLVYQQLKVALADAEANVAALTARLVHLQNRYERIRATAQLKPKFEEQYAQLNRDYEIQKKNFEQLVQRREQAKLTGQLDRSGGVDFRVIDPPRVSPKPVAPNRLKLIVAVLVLSVGAGVACSFIVSRAFPTISSIKELHVFTELSVLGSVSHWPTPKMLRSRRRKNYVFAGGVTGLCALFGLALSILVLAQRMV
jgi:polysaccharide chain length determinant protein (PEP-CTERM system associated)